MDFPLDLHQELRSPPAIVSTTAANCTDLASRLRRFESGSYIMPLSPTEAVSIFPSTDELKLVKALIGDAHRNPISYLFYKHQNSVNDWDASKYDWDVVLEYGNDHKRPNMLYYPRGSIDVIERGAVTVSEVGDLFIYFDFDVGDRVNDTNFGLRQLRFEDKIRIAYLNCVGGFREFFNEKFIKAKKF